MPRKTEAPAAAQPTLEEWIKGLRSEFPSLRALADRSAQAVDVIPTGAATLDLALGIGGIPRGRITEVIGSESAGKSTLSTHIMANAQRAGTGVVVYVDTEQAYDRGYAESLGVDSAKMVFLQPDTAEEALALIEQVARSGMATAIVLDSVAALVAKAELEGDMGEAHVGLMARLMSQACRKLAGPLRASNTALICINQIRNKIGVLWGSPETTPGGMALKYYASVRLDLRIKEKIKKGDEMIGQVVKAKVIKNKLAAPFQEACFTIQYNGAGIDQVGALLDAGLDEALGLFSRRGASIYWGEQLLGQGRATATNRLLEDASLRAMVETAFRAELSQRLDRSHAPVPAPAEVEL